MGPNDTVFGFDVSPFLSGVKKLGEGMDSIQSKAKNMGNVIANGMGKAVNGLILKVGLLVGAFKAAGAVLKEMPEVGQAFGIAKDVFLKNLLWPLRQQVMPLLQKMLDWVRDNRARFVQWGVAVSNVFRTVVVVAKTLWDVMKSLVDVVANAFQKAFQTNFKSFDEFVNVLSFKISAVIIYLGMLAKEIIGDFKPAFDWILRVGGDIVGLFMDIVRVWTDTNEQGKSLWTILDKLKVTFRLIGNFIENAVKGFREGFVPAIKNAMTPIDSIVASFNRLLTLLGFNDSNGIRGAFSALGSIMGTALVGTLSTVASLFDGLVTALGTLAKLAGVVAAIFKGDWGAVKDEFGKVGDLWKEWGARTKLNFSAIAPGKKVNDAIITKNGQVIETHPDDNIIATKMFPSLGSPAPSEASMGPVMIGPFYITTTEGDARNAGQRFGEGLGQGFRDRVSAARLREGN